MRSLLLSLAFLVVAFPRLSAACSCGTSCTCCTEPAKSADASTSPTPAATAAVVGHPLKGVIVEILSAKSALLVKHEEIPGVMKAMTMLLKVDAHTLSAAKKDQAITATLVKKSDGWWLEAVTPVPPAP